MTRRRSHPSLDSASLHGWPHRTPSPAAELGHKPQRPDPAGVQPRSSAPPITRRLNLVEEADWGRLAAVEGCLGEVCGEDLGRSAQGQWGVCGEELGRSAQGPWGVCGEELARSHTHTEASSWPRHRHQRHRRLAPWPASATGGREPRYSW